MNRTKVANWLDAILAIMLVLNGICAAFGATRIFSAIVLTAMGLSVLYSSYKWRKFSQDAMKVLDDHVDAMKVLDDHVKEVTEMNALNGAMDAALHAEIVRLMGVHHDA